MIMNDRHMRELLIALTAIVVVWSAAGGLTLVSTVLFGREMTALDGPTAMINDWLKHGGATRAMSSHPS
jgi:hypothetical protein